MTQPIIKSDIEARIQFSNSNFNETLNNIDLPISWQTLNGYKNEESNFNSAFYGGALIGPGPYSPQIVVGSKSVNNVADKQSVFVRRYITSYSQWSDWTELFTTQGGTIYNNLTIKKDSNPSLYLYNNTTAQQGIFQELDGGTLQILNYTDGNNYNGIYIHKYSTGLSNSLVFVKKIDGTATSYNILHQGNYTEILNNDYVKKTGDTMTGSLTLPTSGSAIEQGLFFDSYASIGAASSKLLGIYSSGGIYIRPGDANNAINTSEGLFIDRTTLRPSKNATMSLGTTSYRFTDGRFSNIVDVNRTATGAAFNFQNSGTQVGYWTLTTIGTAATETTASDGTVTKTNGTKGVVALQIGNNLDYQSTSGTRNAQGYIYLMGNRTARTRIYSNVTTTNRDAYFPNATGYISLFTGQDLSTTTRTENLDRNYYLPMISTSDGQIRNTDGARLRSYFYFEAANAGYVQLSLGNNKVAGTTAGNQRGQIVLYGQSSGYNIIRAIDSTSNYTNYLPARTGVLLNSNIPTSTAKRYIMGVSATASTSTSTAVNADAAIYTQNSVLYGAAWNDYAEFRESDEDIQPGRVVRELGNGKLQQTDKRLEPGCLIVSDTFGYAIGQTEICNTPIAVSGRVLAYPAEDRESYKPGDAVCSGPNGTVSKMSRKEIIYYPERIIGTVSEIPNYDTWGEGNVKVNGRIWISVK